MRPVRWRKRGCASVKSIRSARRHIERLRALEAPLARHAERGLHALVDNDASFSELVKQLSGQAPAEWLTAYRYTRVYNPARAEALLAGVRAGGGTGPAYNAATFEDVRLRIAEGRVANADSVLRAARISDAATYWNTQRTLVAAALPGSGDMSVSRRAVDALMKYLPADSVLAHSNTSPTFWTAWLIAAHHAQFGDVAVARRYQHALATLQAGGSPATYREALQSDIESRLAQRAGNATTALAEARRAYELWSIHTENQQESMPEPAIRFHLAMLLKATGDERAAEPLFRSMVPPTSWFGFYTARSALELGDFAAKRGDSQSAARHYSMALRLWERGGQEAAGWRAQAETRLGSLLNRTRG
jgi:hypothetical protein